MPDGFSTPHTTFGATSSSQDSLLPALLRAKRAFKPITKDAQGVTRSDEEGYHTYRYADLGAHLAAVEPALLEHGLLLEQDIVAMDGPRFLMRTMLTHAESGEWRAGYLPMHTPVSDDPHIAGSRITYARRYGLALFLGLAPRGEDDDGAMARVAATEAPPVKRAAPKRKAEPPTQAEAPAAQEAEPAAPEPARLTPKALVDKIMGAVEAALAAGESPAEAWLAQQDLLRDPAASDVAVEKAFDRYVAAVGEAPPAIEGVTYPEVPDAA